ncbi:MBL fold metallo-hydrolase [Paraburkholderia phytofirmans]|uniref:MBL fold metallo-hydrolase n=1 Tax=Paraburkholderia sp. BL9I2N2 TaxID=1938809 RepID=UPI0010461D81|nr:MBL fold metallo-hydrolase [Paraburkholderia sp. BL9I2N2]TCK91063.1 glyoxylase-like metal-dependent hydrolase (beta-lactamase superfamily II) [Paraburkholderia sp. BL9I2N2]
MPTEVLTHRIGDARITRVSETCFPLAPTVLYPEWASSAADELGRRLSSASLDLEHNEVTLSVHTWVVQIDGLTVLIDTGIGNFKERPFSKLFHQLNNPYLERLADAGILPAQVDEVLLTHLHADHVGWNTQWIDGRWQPTFPNAKYVFPQAEQDFFATPAGDSRRMVFDDSVVPVIESGQAVTIPAEGGTWREGIVFHPTPGHSAGHMSISIRSRGEEAIFTGDVMHNPIQVYRPEWNSTFCLDGASARHSRHWLLNYAADRDATLFTAHFPQTSAGRVRRGADGFEWQYADAAP